MRSSKTSRNPASRSIPTARKPTTAASPGSPTPTAIALNYGNRQSPKIATRNAGLLHHISGTTTQISKKENFISMTKTVLTFGLIAGLIISVLMGGSLLLADKIGSRHSLALGYTIMVASFLLIYFGIRSYRDNTLGGQISFGRAFACGILIALITTGCYVAMWEVLYFNFMPHFMDSYFAAQIHKVQSAGLDPATTAAQVAAIQRSQQLYQNPFVNMAYTFMEPLPVGLIITLISAAILRRKAPVEPTGAPAVMAT